MTSPIQTKFNVRVIPDDGISLNLDTVGKTLYYLDQNGNVQILAMAGSAFYNPANVNITGGNIQGVTLTLDNLDSTPIGINTPAAGAFTTLSASGLVSGVGFSNYLASPPAIGASSANTGAFTVLSVSNTLSGVGVNNLFAAPPALGSTTPNSGAFTTLSTNAVTSVTPVLGFNASNTSFASGINIANNFLQTILQNKSGTTGASTNYVVSNDLSTDSTYYGEFGINSSVFSSGVPSDFFSINNGVYFSGHDGDLTYGSGNGYKSYFAWGLTGASAHVINTSGAIGLSTNLGTTPALSGTTGFGTAGQVMISNGAGAANTWSSTPTLIGTNFTGIPNGALTNSSITFGATAAALGSTVSALNGVSIGATAASTGAFTTLSATGQITSTLASGTAPFIVASNTVVANLNAALLNGTSWAAPGAIGGTTPSTGAFTTLSATGQITSTLASGTAPFVVASNTVVANLNAALLNGTSWAAPGAIGGTTPAAITGTIITANTSFSGALNGSVGATTPSTGAFTTLVASTSFKSALTSTNAAAPTIASAATIAPTTNIAFISGTTSISTITAPSPISTAGGQITLIPTGIFATSTTGNIALASTAVVGKALIMTYDSGTAKWYPSY